MKPKFQVLVLIVLLSIGALAQVSKRVTVDPEREAAAAQAQQQAAQNAVKTDATTNCAYTYTSGTGRTYMQYCVTVNGNISAFQSPSGVEYINVGQVGEGYAVCDETNSIAYYDYAYTDSGNWDTPKLISHTATAVKISRTTSDGNWTLTQTITPVPATPAAKITMALKNNTGGERYVGLLRWADVDADSTYLNNFDGTYGGSAFGNTEEGYGLMLQNVGTKTSFYVQGWPLDSPGGPDPCNLSVTGQLSQQDGSILLFYDNILDNQQTTTVNAVYRPY